jgi:hypothetical protein
LRIVGLILDRGPLRLLGRDLARRPLRGARGQQE